MTAFADLHRPGEPLLLPNAWDHASAAALAAAGFAAVGTTSLGVAAALGLRDGAAETAEATIDLAHRLAHLPVPITIDIEDGFSKDPAAVADYVERLGPVAGVNLEDQLGDPTTHAAVVAAVKARTPAVFVNARTDTYWLGRPSLDETLERARAYVAAGADGIFVPASPTRTRSPRSPRRSPCRSTSCSPPARALSPGSPSSASPASARARCSTASRSVRRSAPRPRSGTEPPPSKPRPTPPSTPSPNLKEVKGARPL